MSKQKKYLVEVQQQKEPIVNLEILIPNISSITEINESHTKTIKDRLVGKLKIPRRITLLKIKHFFYRTEAH